MGRGRVCRGDSWHPLPEHRPATFHRGQTATPTRGGGPVQGQHCTEGQLTRGASRRPGPASTGRGHAVTAVTPVTGIPGCVAQQRAKVCTPCPESGRPERHPHRLLRDDPQPWQERRPATRRVLQIRQAAGLRGLRNTALSMSAPPRLGRPHARPESAPRALAGSLVAARGLSVPRCSAHSAEGCAEEAPPGSRLRHGRAPLSAPQHLCQGPIALATPKRRPRWGRQARGCVGKGTGRAASPAAGAPHPGSPAASLGRRARGQGRSCRPPRGLPDRPGRNSTAAVSAGIAAPTAFRSLQLARKRGRGGDYEAGGRAQGGSGGPRLDGGGSLGPKPCELCLAGTRLLWRKPRAREERPHGTVRPGVLGGQAASRGPGSPTLLCLPPLPRRRGRASAQRPRRDVRAHALAQIRRSSLLLGPFPRKSGAVGLSPGERARGRDWAPRSQGAREGGGRSPGGAPGPAAPWASSWTASTATWTRT